MRLPGPLRAQGASLRAISANLAKAGHRLSHIAVHSILADAARLAE
jgi:hypothetical protein